MPNEIIGMVGTRDASEIKSPLDDGPVVRTLLTGTDVSLPPGCRMVGTLVPVTPAQDGTPRVDFRFAPATGSDLA